MDDKEQFLVEFEDVVNIGKAGTSDFNELANRPSYNGQPMTGATNIPEVPVVNDAKLTINQNGVEKGSFTANDSDDTTIDLDNTTYNDFIGTDGVEAGEAGLVPAPSTTDANKFLKADGTWDEPEETTEIEYIELTPTGVVAQGITVTASKYLDEVIDLAEAGIKVVFKVTLPSGTGFPTEGTYELPLFNWDATSNKALAMTVVALGDTLYSITFGYDLSGIVGDHTNAGIIAIDVVPTGGSGSAIHTLTSADYNWDKTGQGGTPNAIAAWLLEDGIYLVKSEAVYYDTATYSAFNCILIKGTRATGVGFLFGCDRESSWSVRLYADGTSCDIVTNLNSGNLEQIPGNSTTDGMSQDAITKMIFPDSTQINRVAVAGSVTSGAGIGVAVGMNSYVSGSSGVALGAGVTGNTSAVVTAKGGVAIGAGSNATTVGEFNIGSQSTALGYNNTNYRLLTGLHDPQNAHDAATKGYVDANAGGGSVHTLTSADNNYDPYNTGTNRNVAGWLLPSGWYITYDNNGSSNFFIAAQDAPFVSPHSLVGVKITGNGTIAKIFAIDMESQNIIVADVYTSTGLLTDEISLGSFNPRNMEDLYNQIDEFWAMAPWADSGAPDSSFFGTLGQLYTDIDTMHTYQCTAIDDTDPDNPVYTWTQRW